MSYFEFFDLFFGLLHLIRNILRCERLATAANKQFGEVKDNLMNIYQIEACVQLPYINKEGAEILKKLLNQEFGDGKELIFVTNHKAIENFKFIFPKGEDIRKAALNCFCPIIFSSISHDMFYEILCNVLLEKSIIFVSENYNLLASAV